MMLVLLIWTILGCVSALPQPNSVDSARKALECHGLQIPVTAFAQNKRLPAGITLAVAVSAPFLSLLPGLPTTLTGGSYTVNARYCSPTIDVPANRNTLQVLVHGATYTTNYWSGLAAPGSYNGQDQYSWVQYAADTGYATLSVDRLCNGGSTKADSLLECQLPLEVEVLHQVTSLVRSGRFALPGRQGGFSKVVTVCHSLGSLVCSLGSSAYPNDSEGYMLTGFSAVLVNGLSGIGTQPVFLPAPAIVPERFGNLDVGYLTASDSGGAEYLFYFGRYDRAIHDRDFAARGTVTLGEIATALLGQVPVPAYRGALFVMNGDRDSIFCQSDPVSPLLRRPGNCSSGFSERSRQLYPNVRSFGFFNTPEMGHNINTHLTARQSFAAAHDFISRI